jgi:S-adenosylmethionine/arginine decarboxylase-like enzyme
MTGVAQGYLDMTVEGRVFGTQLLMNVYGADPRLLRSRRALRRWVRNVCALNHMNRYGPTRIYRIWTPVWARRFGLSDPKTAGYTIWQAIEQSNVDGHVSEAWGTAYLGFFTCGELDVPATVAFTKEYFGARCVTELTVLRG